MNHLTRFFAPVLLGASLLILPSCNKKAISMLQTQNRELDQRREQLEQESAALASDKATLAAEKAALAEAKARNEALLRGEIRDKEGQVSQLNQELGTTTQDLASKNARILELQRVLDQQQAATTALRRKVSDALLGFNAKDLQVNVKDGKVYVSLSEQLLFKSGSTQVDPKGQDALRKLAAALQGNQDVNVLVEGHTDDVPVRGVVNGAKDNWDLSVLRATEITRILTGAGLNPNQVTPSGRGKYQPVVANDSPANKALNRRTDIILTPKLDELFSILNQN